MKSYQLTDGRDPMSYAEIDRLAELARELPPDAVIVNIGADIGVSTCTFLEARPDVVIYSIDVLPCPSEFTNAIKFGLDISNLNRIQGDSAEAGKIWSFEVEMVFVDGNHFGAAADIAAWRDKVKQEGMMVFHDWQPVPAANNPGTVYEDVQANMDMSKQYGPVIDRLIAFKL